MNRRRKIDFEAIATTYAVSSRTARRWHKRLGRRIHDPNAIAEMLLGMRSPKLETLKIIQSLIQ